METIHLYNLSNLCRICLKKTDSMSNLFDSANGLYDTLTAITDIEIHREETFPDYICSTCRDKILICQQLVSQFKQTHKLLEEYKNCNFVEQDDSEIDLESIAITEIIEFVSEGENVEGLKSVGKVDQDEEKITRCWKLAQMQVSYDKVMEAIGELKKKMNDVKICAECNFQATNYCSLSNHMAFMHKDLKCKWCATCNIIIEDLATHRHVVENSCQFCKKIFSTPECLMKHLMRHARIKPSKRKNSDKTLIYNQTDLDDKSYACSTCGRSFSQLHRLKKHLKQHYYKSEISDFYCERCKQDFDTTKSLQEHSCSKQLSNYKVVKIKQNYCEVCRKKVRSLTVHNRNHHDNKHGENRSLQLCTVCGKQFKNISRLKVHMRVHTGETPYSCNYCDRKMSTKHHLINHERVHTGVKPYVCNICNKAFKQKGNLNTHMKLHTGRPELCIICEKKFCRPAELRLHMKRHTGEKPFICSYCGKDFVQKSHLVEHTRGHSGDKPFKCVHCSRSFRRSSSLKSHVQIHLGEKPFKCTQCIYACRQRYSLTIHMRQHGIDA